MLVLSSFLSHFSVTSKRETTSTRTARRLSVFLRRTGKVLALGNTIWIIVTCVFQFSNFFSRCYCTSSVLGWGARAFGAIEFDHDDIVGIKAACIGGVVLATGTAMIFVAFVNYFLRVPS